MKNVEQAFETLGEQAKAEKCPGIEGIKEHDDFVANESSRRRKSLTRSSRAQAREPSTTRSPRTKAS